ncbi:DUF1453 domain-containing protein [Cohnella zeiphila]|uniref:DUF1453 domain-containing protein n=1 Tax=Cohnella zeiphila TaxID=2761120 RepID=A0A7X0SNL8_9BACL|nr:DUF1453 domain-containing protein [Cohnella zeiphila]MBB6733204.1 DUF1453 domain-containing protein [Cohnella zeiphila]
MHFSVQLVLIVCLVAFAVYRRVRRTVGWQTLRPKSMTVRSVILCVLGVLFLVLGGLHPVSLVSDIIGIVLGIVLAYVGASLTRFEQRGGKLQYLPNPWLGTIVTVLFLGRLAYRMYWMFSRSGQDAMQNVSGAGANPFTGMGGSSWAAGLMMIMFAYYVAYAVLLLRGSSNHRSSIRIG